MNEHDEHEPNGHDATGPHDPARDPRDATSATDPLMRLRDADPAAGIVARPGFADEVVAGIAGGAGEGAPVADLDRERSRRRPRRIVLAVAAAAAAVAIVGGAGYWAGASARGGSVVAEGAAPPISLQSGADTGAQPGAVGGIGAAPEQAKLSAGASDLRYPYGFGRNSFHAAGLSTSEGRAAGYAYDARAVSNTESVAALAAALGIPGTPELKDGSWIAGAQDGSGPTLWVALDGTASFSYSDPAVSPWTCQADGASCEPSGALPSADAAIAALRELIAATGRDAAAYEYTSETWDGAVTRTAQAWPVVDGQRLDQAWSLELAEGGTASAYGQLAPIVALGEYPIVSEQHAFERLSDPRFGAQSTIMPFAAREDAATDGAATGDAASGDSATAWVPPTEPPAMPAAGGPIAWPVNDVEIVGVRLGLASQWQPDGSVVIVPAYEFTDASGGTWSVIAVADSELDLSSE
ncbi:hypothetical protein ACWKWP_09025 [Agromyces soli]